MSDRPQPAAGARDSIALPVLFGVVALLIFVAPVLDPGVQLFYRDTGRLYYEVKLAIAERLAHGQLALWDPWTESGVSLLGQVTPAVLHPFTLLYALLPFDVAFKLNHLLPIGAAGLGTYLLARQLGVSRLAALIPAVAYASCGYLVSMVASNLPYAVGGATMPFALAGFLWFLARHTVARFALASFALSLCVYAGEPQSMLFAGLIGTAWAVGRAALAAEEPRTRLRKTFKAGLFAGAWGLSALALSGPASGPAAAQLLASDRLHGVSTLEQEMFANHPLRLFGLLVPFAFDDSPERFSAADQDASRQPFLEYFSPNSGSFADSILLGPPVLLLAACAARRRRGVFLLLGAFVLALASTGAALGVWPVLAQLVPGIRVFRFAEKFIAPASLLLSLAAGLGAAAALEEEPRRAVWLGGLAGALAALLGATLLATWPLQRCLTVVLIDMGVTHNAHLPELFLESLRSGLWVSALLALAVSAIALLRSREKLAARGALLLLALCCTTTAYAATIQQLHTLPIELVREQPVLVRELVARAGPSRGRWRLFVSTWTQVPFIPHFEMRVAHALGSREMLLPQFESLFGIEGINPYFSAPDLQYNRAVMAAPSVLFSLLRVRFAVHMPWQLTPQSAKQYGFIRMMPGAWVHEFPVGPAAFLVSRADSAPTEAAALDLLAGAGFDPHSRAVVLAPEPAFASAPLQKARTTIKTLSPEVLQIDLDADQPALLVVPQHHDPGWRATVDGAAAKVIRTDLTVLGVHVPAGHHTVLLRFWPVGFTAGLWAAGGLVALFLLGSWWERQSLSPE